MKAFIEILVLGSVLVTSSLLSGGSALADEPAVDVLPKATLSAEGTVGNAGVGATAGFKYRSPGYYGVILDVQAGAMQTYNGKDRPLGNVAAYGACADLFLCFGSPRIVHSDGRYEQISPLPFSFGGIGENGTFFMGPRIFVLRDQVTGKSYAGFGGDAFYEHTIGHGDALSVLAQLATTYGGSGNTQTEGLFYELEAKYRKKLKDGWAANFGLDVSDNMVKQLDVYGNPVGSFSTNTQVSLTGGLMKLW